MKTIILLIIVLSLNFCVHSQSNIPLAKRSDFVEKNKLTNEELLPYHDSYFLYKNAFKATDGKSVGTIEVKHDKIPVYCSESVFHKMGFKKIRVEIKSNKIERIDFVDCNFNIYSVENNEKLSFSGINGSKVKLWSTNHSANKKCAKSYIYLSEVLYWDLTSSDFPTDTIVNLTDRNTTVVLDNIKKNKLLTLEEFVIKKQNELIRSNEVKLEQTSTSNTNMTSLNSDTITLTKDEIEEVVESKMADFKAELKRKVEVDNNKAFLVGKIYLRDVKVNRYCNENGDSTLKIDRVKLSIENGTIVDIQIVDSNYEVFSNGNAPIELKRLNKRHDRLYSENGSKHYKCENGYLKLSDILYYELNTIYTPKDTTIYLNSENNNCTLRRKSSIDQHVDLRIYSDLLGLIGNESNGLIQTEFHVNSDLHQKNVWGSPWYFFKYFDFVFKASKFDTDFQSVNISEDFNRADLNQRSWLNTNLRLNFLTLTNLKSRFNMSLDISGGFNVVEITPGDSTFSNIALPKLGLEYSVVISSAPNFNAQIKLPIIFQNSPYFSGKNLPVNNGMRTIISPQIEFLWHPLEKREDGVFGRVTYVNINGDGSPFWTFQVGYNISLSGLFQTK